MSERGEPQGRLSSGPDPLIQEAYGAPHIAADLAFLSHHLAVHRAWLAMLLERGIVTRGDAAAIFTALDEIERSKGAVLPLRPELNDLYTCTEAYLVRERGEEVGGRLHTGRSRNDLFVTLARLAARDGLLGLVDDVIDFRATLLDRAQAHVDTIFPGYTHHSQQAQPITFAHFLLAHHDALGRDLERLEAALGRVDRSPLGGAALAGTGFPIDRERVAGLLGFERLIENSADATGSRDFQLETGAAAVILCATLGRLAESLILYSSTEFALIELDDAMASVSSIMPQKKNPVSLEMVEAMEARAAATFTAMVVLLKSATLGQSRETGYCDGEVQTALTSASLAVRITNRAVVGLTVDATRALALVTEGQSTTTELADRLVRERGLSFRQAHHVVANAVARTHATHQPLTVDVLHAAALDVLGRDIPIDEPFVRSALDPSEGLRVRTSVGAPAPAEVRRMLTERQESHPQEVARVAQRRARLDDAQHALAAAVSLATNL